MVARTSYGRMMVKEPKVVKVTSTKKWKDYTSCNSGPWRTEANALLKAQGVDPNQYTYREYFVPKQNHMKCAWAGLATVGCGHPSRLPNPGACWAMYRAGGAFVR